MNKATYFDLDGTFIKVNSFHAWVKILIFGQHNASVWFRVRIALYAFSRVIRARSHTDVKASISKAFENIERDLQSEIIHLFLPVINKEVNCGVLNLLQKKRAEGERCVLATAAPIYYARPFSKLFKFDGVIASTINIETIKSEKEREIKRDATLHKINEWTIVTDHKDDLPSINSSSVAVWIGSAMEAKEIILQSDGKSSSSELSDGIYEIK